MSNSHINFTDILNTPLHCGDSVLLSHGTEIVVGVVIKKTGTDAIHILATYIYTVHIYRIPIINKYATTTHSSTVDIHQAVSLLKVPPQFLDDLVEAVKDSDEYEEAVRKRSPDSHF